MRMESNISVLMFVYLLSGIRIVMNYSYLYVIVFSIYWWFMCSYVLQLSVVGSGYVCIAGLAPKYVHLHGHIASTTMYSVL